MHFLQIGINEQTAFTLKWARGCMQNSKSVKNLVRIQSWISLGAVFIFASLGMSAELGSDSITAARVRQSPAETRSDNQQYVSLKKFNSELSLKAKEYQKTAAYTTLENSQQRIIYKINHSKSVISGNVQLTYAQSMIDQNDGNKKAFQSIMTTISGMISEDYTLTARISASQDLENSDSDETNGVSDLGLILSKKQNEIADWITGGFSFISTLPTSSYSRDYQNFQGSLGTAYTFSLTDQVLAQGVSTSLSVSANRNFHKFETDANGRNLNIYGLKESLVSTYTTGSFLFSFEFLHRHAWDYSGTVSQAFEHTEEVSYSITQRWSASLGHTNAGSWLTPNGQDSNLKVINENDSIIYGSMSLVF